MWLVTVKELREILRDPHVVLFLAFPLLFYPMLLWGSTQLAILQEGWAEQRPYTVDVTGPDALVQALLAPPAVAGQGGVEALERGEVDLVVRADAHAHRWTVTVHRAEGRADSRRAADQVDDRLDHLRDERLAALAEAHGLGEHDLDPLRIRTEVVSTGSELAARFLGLLFGLLGPFTMLMAGVYPAVDLVVAERERGTLETTLVAGAPRAALLGGKLLACVTLMVAATVANLGTLALTVAQLGVSLELDLLWYTPPPGQILATIPVVVATAVLCAAVYLLAMVAARTFKEGEYAGSVVLMLGAMPVAAVASALVDEEVGWLRFVPLANTAVALFEAVIGELTAGTVLLATAENGLLAALLLLVAVRVVGREDWLIGGKLPRWLAWMRRGGSK